MGGRDSDSDRHHHHHRSSRKTSTRAHHGSSRGSSSVVRASRIPAPTPVTTTKKGPGRMIINMTTTITTQGTHSGVIVHSGVQSPGQGGRPSSQQSGVWPYGSSSGGMPMITTPGTTPLPIGQNERPLALPSMVEAHPSTSEAPTPLQRPASPPSHSPVWYHYSPPPSLSQDYLDPDRVRLNVFNTEPQYASLPGSERLSRRDQAERQQYYRPPPVNTRSEPMRGDTTTTHTLMEVYREPGEPLNAYQNVVLPPGRQPDLMYGPKFEKYERVRTESMDGRPSSVKGVQWKEDLVDQVDIRDEPMLTVNTFERDRSTSPSYVAARKMETVQETKEGRLVRETFNEEDVTVERGTGPLTTLLTSAFRGPGTESPALFSPSSYHTASEYAAAPQLQPLPGTIRPGISPAPYTVGSGVQPYGPLANSPGGYNIGGGAAPYRDQSPYTVGGGAVPSVGGYSIGQGARPAMSPGAYTVGSGAWPSWKRGSRPRTPDDYHDRVPRHRSVSPATYNRPQGPLSPYYDAYYPTEWRTQPSPQQGYGRPPPSYQSSVGGGGRGQGGYGSRGGTPLGSQPDLNRNKSGSGDIFMLYQTRDALQNIVGHL